MTTATSPFCSCGAVAGGTSAAFGARAGGLSDYDLDRYRHALTQRGIGIGDHDPQTIDQIRAQIGRFYRFGRELGARRNEPDLALIEFVGGIAANAHPHSGRDTPQIRSEERRVGKECVSTCRSRWSPYH